MDPASQPASVLDFNDLVSNEQNQERAVHEDGQSALIDPAQPAVRVNDIRSDVLPSEAPAMNTTGRHIHN